MHEDLGDGLKINLRFWNTDTSYYKGLGGGLCKI